MKEVGLAAKRPLHWRRRSRRRYKLGVSHQADAHARPRACTVAARRRKVASVHVTAAHACRADTLGVDMSALSRRLGGHRAAHNAASALTIGPTPDSAR